MVVNPLAAVLVMAAIAAGVNALISSADNLPIWAEFNFEIWVAVKAAAFAVDRPVS